MGCVGFMRLEGRTGMIVVMGFEEVVVAKYPRVDEY